MVLKGGHNDDVAGQISLDRLPIKALDRQVVGLGPAACEYDLAGGAIQQPGDRLARLFDLLADRSPRSMQAGGVAELLDLGGQSLEGLWNHGRGRRVIQVDIHALSLRT